MHQVKLLLIVYMKTFHCVRKQKARQGRHPARREGHPGNRGDQGNSCGDDSISPNRHPEINNNEQLLDFIERVKTITGSRLA